MDQGGPRAAVDFAAQPADVTLDEVRMRVEMQIPDLLEKHRAGHHSLCMAHQVFEQAQLTRLQIDGLVCAPDSARKQVNFEVGHT